MRVALVLETSGGGSGRHVVDLAAGLVARSVDPLIVYSPRRAEPEFVKAAAAACPRAPIAVDMRKRPGLAQVSSLRDLRATLAAFAPDVVHAHSSVAGLLTRVLPTSAARIYTPHAFKSMDPGLGRVAQLGVAATERLLSRRGDAVVVVSQAEYDEARRLGVPTTKLHKIVNGVDADGVLDRRDARAELGVPVDGPLLGWVGRFVDQKDPLAFAGWVEAVRASLPDARAVMVGDGPLLAATRDEVARRGLADAVDFAGSRPAARLMRAFDVLCMTSAYEAMPYTLLEALAAGTPIVSTNVGGTAEAVHHGETGYVVDHVSVRSLLPALLGDERLIASFSEQSRALASTRTAHEMVDATLRVYERVSA